MVVDLQKLQKEISSLKSKKKEKESSNLKQVVKVKGITKYSKATLTLKEKPKDTYVPIYFQAELNNAKRQMFFD